jgi:hypothetical protein
MATWGPTGIAATNDDGYQTGSAAWATNGIFIGNDGSAGLHGGFRFLNVTVPAGSTINSATITIHARSVSGTVTNVHATFRGYDVDDAAQWLNSTGPMPFQADKTTASADFDPTAWVDGTDYSYTITSIVAEIVARAGWASGSDLSICLMDDSSTASNFVRAYDYGDGDAVVRLTIDYTEAAAGQDLTGATLASGASLLAATLARNQIALPVLDIADGNWISYPEGIPGNNVNMWNDLDETVPNDKNAIRSGATPSNDTYTCALSSLATPGAGDVIVRVRARYC